MATVVTPNDYKFEQKTVYQNQVKHTNSTTRILKTGELVVHQDALGQAFIGVVKDNEGIAASGGVGYIDLLEGKEITTNQFTAASFIDGDVGIFVDPQTNSSEAKIIQASASGLFALNALIIEYTAGTLLRLRMPSAQTGTITAVP